MILFGDAITAASGNVLDALLVNTPIAAAIIVVIKLFLNHIETKNKQFQDTLDIMEKHREETSAKLQSVIERNTDAFINIERSIQHSKFVSAKEDGA